MCRASSLLAGLERRCRQTALPWGGGGGLIVAFPWYSGELGRPVGSGSRPQQRSGIACKLVIFHLP